MTRQPDVYVIQKQTAIERYTPVGLDFFGYLERDEQALTSVARAHAEHVDARTRLLRTLDARGLSYEIMNLDEIANSDIGFFQDENPSSGLRPRERVVLALGGDGTLLHASHFCGGDVRLVGVNSSPGNSVGHLCALKPDTVEEGLEALLSGQLPCAPVPRLKIASSKGHRLPLALNDLLFSHRHPAATSRYGISLSQDGRSLNEKHQSSGVWVAAPAGSTAAIRTYGLPRLELTARKFLFAVREIYIPPEASVSLVGGILDGETDSMTFFCRMRQGMVCVDGPDSSAHLGFGETLTVTLPPSGTLQLVLA